MRILVIDAQGGGLGRQLIKAVKEQLPDAFITAVGTNSTATEAMLKGGADLAATGENAVKVAAQDADVIMGPVGICIADAMGGEITKKMAVAVGRSAAKRVLIPFQNCNTYIAGVGERKTAQLIADAVAIIAEEDR